MQFRRTLADVYNDLGMIPDAIELLDESADLAPDSADTVENLAKAARLAGAPERAQAYQLKEIELRPGQPWPLWRLAEHYRTLGQDEKALEAVNEAIELHPNPMQDENFRFYTTRGDIYARLKMYTKALADYSNKSLELAPYRQFTYKRRGGMHFELKDFDAALADLNMSLELDPGELSVVSWISADKIAKCPSPEFREGMKRLADRAVKLNDESEAALLARAQLIQGLGDLPPAPHGLEQSMLPADQLLSNQMVLRRHPTPLTLILLRK